MFFFGKLNNYFSCEKIWKIFAITQFCIILFMVYSGYPTPKTIEDCKPQKINISALTEEPITRTYNYNKEKETIIVPKNESNKTQFDPQVLELYQSQTDIKLIKEIHASRLRPPSELPYNITSDTTTDMSGVKSMRNLVTEIFSGKKNGFFIECGAFNGVWLSNTLELEQEYNWTGLLVEADPIYYAALLLTQRKAWSINACLATLPYKHDIEMTRLKDQPAYTRITTSAGQHFLADPDAQNFQAHCLPLATILSSIGQTMNIDYFSLDIETAELKVLKTIPWDFVYIKVLSLEAEYGSIIPIKKFLATKNYKFLKEVRGAWIHDYVFIHNQFKNHSYYWTLHKSHT